MTYKFENWNIDIVDPVVTFNNVDKSGDPIINNVNKADMTIAVDILMTTKGGTKFGYNLDEISVQDLDYTTAKNVMDRVMVRLKDFEI